MFSYSYSYIRICISVLIKFLSGINLGVQPTFTYDITDYINFNTSVYVTKYHDNVISFLNASLLPIKSGCTYFQLITSIFESSSCNVTNMPSYNIHYLSKQFQQIKSSTRVVLVFG